MKAGASIFSSVHVLHRNKKLLTACNQILMSELQSNKSPISDGGSGTDAHYTYGCK